LRNHCYEAIKFLFQEKTLAKTNYSYEKRQKELAKKKKKEDKRQRKLEKQEKEPNEDQTVPDPEK